MNKTPELIGTNPADPVSMDEIIAFHNDWLQAEASLDTVSEPVIETPIVAAKAVLEAAKERKAFEDIIASNDLGLPIKTKPISPPAADTPRVTPLRVEPAKIYEVGNPINEASLLRRSAKRTAELTKKAAYIGSATTVVAVSYSMIFSNENHEPSNIIAPEVDLTIHSVGTDAPLIVEVPNSEVTVPETTQPVQPIEEITVVTLPDTTTTTLVTVPETTQPASLSLTERIQNGETTLDQNRGIRIGTLRLNKYCDDVEVFVNSRIDFHNPEIKDLLPQVLSEEAMSKIAMLQQPGLSSSETLALESDIQSTGFKSGKGDPIYALSEDRTPVVACEPQGPNPRDTKDAYGSTKANASGQKASYFQPVASMYEFGSIPGIDGQVTVVDGHATSESAPFYSFTAGAPNGYQNGETITYVTETEEINYQMIGRRQFSAGKKITDIISELNQDAAGNQWFVIQLCIPGQPDLRDFVIFERI